MEQNQLYLLIGVFIIQLYSLGDTYKVIQNHEEYVNPMENSRIQSTKVKRDVLPFRESSLSDHSSLKDASVKQNRGLLDPLLGGLGGGSQGGGGGNAGSGNGGSGGGLLGGLLGPGGLVGGLLKPVGGLLGGLLNPLLGRGGILGRSRTKLSDNVDEAAESRNFRKQNNMDNSNSSEDKDSSLVDVDAGILNGDENPLLRKESAQRLRCGDSVHELDKRALKDVTDLDADLLNSKEKYSGKLMKSNSDQIPGLRLKRQLGNGGSLVDVNVSALNTGSKSGDSATPSEQRRKRLVRSILDNERKQVLNSKVLNVGSNIEQLGRFRLRRQLGGGPLVDANVSLLNTGSKSSDNSTPSEQRQKRLVRSILDNERKQVLNSKVLSNVGSNIEQLGRFRLRRQLGGGPLVDANVSLLNTGSKSSDNSTPSEQRQKRLVRSVIGNERKHLRREAILVDDLQNKKINEEETIESYEYQVSNSKKETILKEKSEENTSGNIKSQDSDIDNQGRNNIIREINKEKSSKDIIERRENVDTEEMVIHDIFDMHSIETDREINKNIRILEQNRGDSTESSGKSNEDSGRIFDGEKGEKAASADESTESSKNIVREVEDHIRSVENTDQNIQNEMTNKLDSIGELKTVGENRKNYGRTNNNNKERQLEEPIHENEREEKDKDETGEKVDRKEKNDNQDDGFESGNMNNKNEEDEDEINSNRRKNENINSDIIENQENTMSSKERGKTMEMNEDIDDIGIKEMSVDHPYMGELSSEDKNGDNEASNVMEYKSEADLDAMTSSENENRDIYPDNSKETNSKTTGLGRSQTEDMKSQEIVSDNFNMRGTGGYDNLNDNEDDMSKEGKNGAEDESSVAENDSAKDSNDSFASNSDDLSAAEDGNRNEEHKISFEEDEDTDSSITVYESREGSYAPASSVKDLTHAEDISSREEHPDHFDYSYIEYDFKSGISESSSSEDKASEEASSMEPESSEYTRRYSYFPYNHKYNFGKFHSDDLYRMFWPFTYRYPQSLFYNNRFSSVPFKRSVPLAQSKQLEMPILSRYPSSVAGSNLYGSYAYAHTSPFFGGGEGLGVGEEELILGEEEGLGEFGRR